MQLVKQEENRSSEEKMQRYKVKNTRKTGL